MVRSPVFLAFSGVEQVLVFVVLAFYPGQFSGVIGDLFTLFSRLLVQLFLISWLLLKHWYTQTFTVLQKVVGAYVIFTYVSFTDTYKHPLDCVVKECCEGIPMA